jgi:hypothetical protein
MRVITLSTSLCLSALTLVGAPGWCAASFPAWSALLLPPTPACAVFYLKLVWTPFWSSFCIDFVILATWACFEPLLYPWAIALTACWLSDIITGLVSVMCLQAYSVAPAIAASSAPSTLVVDDHPIDSFWTTFSSWPRTSIMAYPVSLFLLDASVYNIWKSAILSSLEVSSASLLSCIFTLSLYDVHSGLAHAEFDGKVVTPYGLILSTYSPTVAWSAEQRRR